MSFETELKLSLSRDQVEKLKQHAFWQKHAAEPVSFHLGNTYFDTPDRQLNQARIALRIREKNGQYFQTLKTKGESVNGLTRRGEWEWPIAGPVLDIAGLHKACPEIIAKIDTDALQPIFATDFDRISWMISWSEPEAQIEASLDVGLVKADSDSSPICELELELMTGNEQALAIVAERLGQTIPLTPADKSKAERGFELLTKQIPGQ